MHDRGKNPHQSMQSIRKHSWFEKKKKTMYTAELLKFMYGWTRDIS